MNLVKLILPVCSVVLASLLLGSVSAQASDLATRSDLTDSVLPVSLNVTSDQPLILKGCGCTQCLKSDQLQGRLPGL